MPAAPQNVRLVSGSTQEPPQLTRPAWHDTEHVPVLQTCPVEHVEPALPASTPQPSDAPQLERLVCGSTQLPPQLTRPAWQEMAQVPALHTCPWAQLAPALPPLGLPQPAVAPQLLRLVSGSMHVVPHLMRPGAQESEQAPSAQTSPASQVLPGEPLSAPQPAVAPQYSRLVLGLTHPPLQSTRSAGHERAHTPLAQTCPLGQALPASPPVAPQPGVAPQNSRLTCGSMHEPPQVNCASGHLGAPSKALSTTVASGITKGSCPLAQHLRSTAQW